MGTPCRTFSAFAALRRTLVPLLSFPRNDGVRGSSPRVGFAQPSGFLPFRGAVETEGDNQNDNARKRAGRLHPRVVVCWPRVRMNDFQPTDRRFLPPGEANERDLEGVEARIRRTIAKVFPRIPAADEIADLVAEGLVIAEEIQREVGFGESVKQALDARLANRLRDYRRAQHPEVRRDTRARRKAAERGDEYRPKVWAATGPAHEHGDVWSSRDPEPAADAMAEAYDRLKLEELEGITSARELMLDPQKAGLLVGVASYHLATARAERAFEELQDVRLEYRPRTRFKFMRDI
jgi:hypothetical protein